MKIQRKLNSSTIIEVEAGSMVQLFEELSAMEELFRCGPCGLCKGSAIGYRTREVSGIKFHEAVCLGCGAAFAFGVRKGASGALFPQRRDAEGKVKLNGGWARWTPTNGNGGAEPTSAQPDDF